jgi:hypothetical protein
MVHLSEGNKKQLNLYQISPLWLDTLIDKLATATCIYDQQITSKTT